MLCAIIDLIEALRKSYGDFQDRSFMGQSEMDRRSRRLVNVTCGILIALILIGGGAWKIFFS